MLLVIAAACYVLLQIPTGYMICIRHNSRPYDYGVVLPDSFHRELMPIVDHPIMNTLVKIISYVVIILTLIAFVFHAKPLLLFRIFFVMMSTLSLIRIVFLASTYFPAPSKICNCVPTKIYKLNFITAMQSLFNLDSCNTIFPAFVYATIICARMWSVYLNDKVGLVVSIIVLNDVLLELLARRSYTFDVLMTGIISISIFEVLHHSLYTNIDAKVPRM